jgi:hypothetical protein
MSAFRKVLTLAVLVFAGRAHVLNAQSTFGSIVGTVRDATGAVIADASVRIQNLNDNTVREMKSSVDGYYEALNLKPATYTVAVSRAGFQSYLATEVQLVARQTVRVDAALQVGQLEQAVTVEASAGVIASETQTIASSLDTLKVLNPPANFRASGNTSPYRLIGTLPVCSQTMEMHSQSRARCRPSRKHP